MKFLLTGGAGYVGRVMASELAARGDHVIILDNFLYGNGVILPPGKQVELHHGDVRDTKSVRKLANDMDAVIHLAAIVGDPACDLDKERANETNFTATKNIAQVCSDRNIPMVFFSTCSVYGASRGQTLSEDDPVGPLSTYATSKLDAEKSVQALVPENLIFRLGTVFGLSPRMRFDLAINRMIAQATLDRRITVFGGQQFRPFIHVRDVVANTLKAVDSNARGLYNLGGQNYKILDVGAKIRDLTKCEMDVQTGSTDARDYAVNSSQASEDWGANFDHEVEFAVKEISNSFHNGTFNTYSDPAFHNVEWLKRSS